MRLLGVEEHKLDEILLFVHQINDVSDYLPKLIEFVQLLFDEMLRKKYSFMFLGAQVLNLFDIQILSILNFWMII